MNGGSPYNLIWTGLVVGTHVVADTVMSEP